MPVLRRSVMVAVLVASGLSLAACANTVRGVGKDVNATGKAVKATAEGHP